MSRLSIGFVIFAAAYCGLAAPALAQSEIVNPPTQVYAGPIIGFDSVVGGDAYGSAAGDGVTYGGVLGVSAPTGAHARVGLEAEVDGSSASRTYYDGVGDTLRLKAGRDLFIGAHLGYMIAPRVETYIKAGYTNARISATVSDGVDSVSAGRNFGGYRVGAGAELALDKVHFRLEYRYSNYGKLNIDGYDTGVSGSRHQVVVGATYPL